MAATTESKTTAQLKKTVASQKETLSKALTRISNLTDEIAILRGELNRFKSDVANDVKYLTQRVDGTD